VKQGIDRLLAAFGALLQVERAVKVAMRVAALARALLQIMDERINVALGDIRVGRQIILRVEKPGFFSDLVVAEKRCHSVPA
jgi:hypothetical protein